MRLCKFNPKNILRHRSMPIFLFFGLVWVLGYIPIYRFSQEDVKKQINKIWYQAVSYDCKNRLIKTGLKYIRKPGFREDYSSSVTIETKKGKKELGKETIVKPANEEEQEQRALQTALLEKKTVESDKLDSLFQVLLKKEGISTPTAVSYTNANNKQIDHSTTDSTFYKHALATTEIKTGIDNSIILRGYVGLSWIDYIKHAKLLSILWFLSGVLACLTTYFYKKNRGNRQKEKTISTEANQPQILVYHTNYRILTYGMQSVQLTPTEGNLLHALINANNCDNSYDELLLLLWGDKETDKRRLEQIRYKLDKKIRCIPGLQINTLERYGYQLQIPEEYTIQTEE